MVQRDIYRAPNAPDPVLDDATVLRFVRAHLPSASAVTAIDETGGEARAYVIDEQYIFKTQRPHRVRERTSIEKAVFHQRAIAKDSPEISVSRVLGYGREGDIEYVLETRIPGVAVRNIALEGEARRAVLGDLGRSLRRIHAVPLEQFEGSGLFPGDGDEAGVRIRIVEGLRRAAQAIATQDEPWPLEVEPVALAEGMLTHGRHLDFARSALHSNPGPEHAFVDPSSLRFQGIIDFGDAYISHPAFDMRRWTSPDDRAALIEGYASGTRIADSFLHTWLTVLVGGLMATIAGLGPGAITPERRKAAAEDLRSLIPELW